MKPAIGRIMDGGMNCIKTDHFIILKRRSSAPGFRKRVLDADNSIASIAL
jgi:hypothetical protein